MVPSAPAAPPMFSTMTACPSSFLIASAVRRAMMSVLPPGANGTMSLIGRDGYVSAAHAPLTTAHDAMATRMAFQLFTTTLLVGLVAPLVYAVQPPGLAI